MILAMQSGPYLKTPFEADFIDKLKRRRQSFADLAPSDVQGFADVNVDYYTDLTARTQNRFLREMQLGLFFQTSRMWLITLPLMQWGPIVSAVCDEISELVRVAEDQDPTGFGLVMRNHIFMARRRLFEAEGEAQATGS
jgi:DNA-binding GntR family transcriptional regulator